MVYVNYLIKGFWVPYFADKIVELGTANERTRYSTERIIHPSVYKEGARLEALEKRARLEKGWNLRAPREETTTLNTVQDMQ